MMRTSRLLGVTAVAMALGFTVGCANPNGGNTPGGGSDQLGTSAPGLTAPASVVPTTTPPPPAATYPNTASAYATAAVTAWKTGDTGRLSELSDPGNGIWSTLNGGNYNKAFHVYLCDGAAGSSICAMYNAVGDELDLRLENDLIGHAHAVIDGQWHPITFPTDYKLYAQEAIDDWGKHNTAAVALLTGKPGDSAFSSVPSSHRNDQWTFDSEDGGMGSEFFTFVNPAGDQLIVRFANPGIVPPPANRHGLITGVSFQPHP